MALTEAQKKQAEKTRKYWADREEEALKQRIKDEKQYDRRINQIYSDMLDNVQSEINAFYGKYADKEGISIAEAKKRVKSLDIETYERKAKRYVRDKEFSAQANEEMRLYNATMRINRLEMLKANIGLELINGHQELEDFMSGILKDRTEDELKRQAGILGKTIKNNAEKANSIVNASFHNATFSDRVWQYQNMMKAELSKLLQSGLIQGKNPRALAKELKKHFNASTFNAERLMRTELARVQTDAQKQSFERNGFKEYEFIVNTGCCDICAGLNGKRFKVIDMRPGENAPPMHPHCRCSTAAYEDSKEYNAWLDYLEKGGTTETYNKLKATSTKSGKEKQNIEDMTGAKLFKATQDQVKVEKIDNATRVEIQTDGAYSSVVFYDDKSVFIDEINIKQSGQGVGLKFFDNLIKGAKENGYERIQLLAAGDIDSKNNGYYTWAKFGFNGDLSFSFRRRAERELGIKAETVQDIMSAPGGSEWWRKHGSAVSMEFDLSEDSLSMEIWEKYTAKKKKK